MRIGVVGAGYVGLTTAACFAHLGHQVTCADVDEAKVAALNAGEVALHEPGLRELVAEGLGNDSLRFVRGSALSDVDFTFVCVQTPSGPGGEADLSAVEAVLAGASAQVVLKSTVPVGTAARHPGVVSNPEFLREGHAVEDFLRPQRIVVGAQNEQQARAVAELYENTRAPVVLTDNTSAELVKYASNCFLALKLSYVNTLAELCEHLDADIDGVTEGMRLDDRIGASCLHPGPGWGGSCLPKDTLALLATARSAGIDFATLEAAITTNLHQPHRVVDRIRDEAGSLQGKRIGLLGLAFKAGTNDLRDSPALAVAEILEQEGARLVAYDPCVTTTNNGIAVVGSAAEVAAGADVLVVLTEWPEFAELDWPELAKGVRTPLIFDTRGVVPPDKAAEAGFRLVRTGR
ncbi:UDP-glucose/GDP-mannose dehydrogenase family protein [Lentzea sp. HUAS12]|uniref:UDP-glucose dehydrogenase family protein n=1 Tax=Lentzea sp. HUAS12 TaxID=2951806 RepID=UPI00209EB4ED|nr:UDP-glucose/GDP-mannose dehydrogenase family protein [Lentzea sp. HUAS12]USX53278.1 UDP-glucose/GDP-mannose dehydrogenase family protein [Lentzea sp. HUAS12]